MKERGCVCIVCCCCKDTGKDGKEGCELRMVLERCAQSLLEGHFDDCEKGGCL